MQIMHPTQDLDYNNAIMLNPASKNRSGV